MAKTSSLFFNTTSYLRFDRSCTWQCTHRSAIPHQHHIWSSTQRQRCLRTHQWCTTWLHPHLCIIRCGCCMGIQLLSQICCQQFMYDSLVLSIRILPLSFLYLNSLLVGQEHSTVGIVVSSSCIAYSNCCQWLLSLVWKSMHFQLFGRVLELFQVSVLFFSALTILRSVVCEDGRRRSTGWQWMVSI